MIAKTRRTTDLIFDVAARISRGATLLGPFGYSVGPYRSANDGDAVRFACLTLQGAVVDALEFSDEVSIQFSGDRTGWSSVREERVARDWSAFGAAAAFVAAASDFGAAAAIEKFDRGLEIES